ncbi:hypothetical protein I4U23_020373 [Adineta vaga]|nr:hypothetical protein I4U23_020373 [Adineta vaga]
MTGLAKSSCNNIQMGMKNSKQRNDSVYNNRTILEDLSNELIYEVFDYLSFRDIFIAFGKVNGRLKNLIDNYSHYLNLQQHTSNDIQIFPRSIRSLKINARYQYSFIDFTQLNSLHHLLLSNLSPTRLLHIFNTISLQELQYVYLGVCEFNDRSEENQLKEVQQKILALGQSNLQKCIFRMSLRIDIDTLPVKLIFLKYLRIDGCENLSFVNQLLDRMPNLLSLYVSGLKSFKIDEKYTDQYRHSSLCNLNLRVQDFLSKDELIPFLKQHCPNLENLIIQFSSINVDNSNQRVSSLCNTDLHQWLAIEIYPLMPNLTNFHVRQRVISQNYKSLQQIYYTSPYIEDVPYPFEDKSCRVTIASHLADIWIKKT